MGFSAFSGGGRFEALYRTGGRGDCTGAGKLREARVVSMASFAMVDCARAGKAREEGRSRRDRPCQVNRLPLEVTGLPLSLIHI